MRVTSSLAAAVTAATATTDGHAPALFARGCDPAIAAAYSALSPTMATGPDTGTTLARTMRRRRRTARRPGRGDRFGVRRGTRRRARGRRQRTVEPRICYSCPALSAAVARLSHLAGPLCQ